MALSKDEKAQIIEQYRIHLQDTGSTEVQIAQLTEEIRRLTEHLKTHRKDFHSQRGLMLKVGRRKRLLRYLARTRPEQYTKLIAQLGLRG
ncbi:MAG: 30S ribosomal protein S15 [Candidatus Bipolaricaulota bacterium]|nr:30S ribosomal protein S15 [Candidatus Bipolaricaulota bacterium]MCS7275198.1 30S ribosomal protein S15 [Candidatus Bipolaricaulota bacterium]MDW8111407.1 30S ribosomal protein S15 [Candidatus Bipolaricaulota bacterium]MDW8329662.1 30S ribosomal protein S15 [Candidatus Bipolaricaulota bacterium]